MEKAKKVKINFFNNALHFRVGWRLYFSHLLTAARGIPSQSKKYVALSYFGGSLITTYLYANIVPNLSE